MGQIADRPRLTGITARCGLYTTAWWAPAIGLTSDAALIFYGASMLLAAACCYAGCEALAVSNWLLRRDDQVGCVLFACGPARARPVAGLGVAGL